jgi:hypothetical protein
VKRKVRKVILVVCLVKSGGRHRFSFFQNHRLPTLPLNILPEQQSDYKPHILALKKN